MAYPQPYNPYGSYNPGMAYQPQPVAYAPQPQQPTQQVAQSTQEAFICRPVTSREEALATPVDYMRALILPDIGHGKVYLKRFNTQTGASDIFDFTLSEPEQAKPAPQYATVDDLNALKEEIEKLKKPVGKGKKSDDE